MEDLTGKQLGQYQVVEPLGAGGMATVVKAFQPSMERYVALKVIHPERVEEGGAGFRDEFEREAKLLASLNHPGIATIHDVDEHDGLRFLVMELVNGPSLPVVLGVNPCGLDPCRLGPRGLDRGRPDPRRRRGRRRCLRSRRR